MSKARMLRKALKPLRATGQSATSSARITRVDESGRQRQRQAGQQGEQCAGCADQRQACFVSGAQIVKEARQAFALDGISWP